MTLVSFYFFRYFLSDELLFLMNLSEEEILFKIFFDKKQWKKCLGGKGGRDWPKDEGSRVLSVSTSRKELIRFVICLS